MKKHTKNIRRLLAPAMITLGVFYFTYLVYDSKPFGIEDEVLLLVYSFFVACGWFQIVYFNWKLLTEQ